MACAICCQPPPAVQLQPASCPVDIPSRRRTTGFRVGAVPSQSPPSSRSAPGPWRPTPPSSRPPPSLRLVAARAATCCPPSARPPPTPADGDDGDRFTPGTWRVPRREGGDARSGGDRRPRTPRTSSLRPQAYPSCPLAPALQAGTSSGPSSLADRLWDHLFGGAVQGDGPEGGWPISPGADLRAGAEAEAGGAAGGGPNERFGSGNGDGSSGGGGGGGSGSGRPDGAGDGAGDEPDEGAAAELGWGGLVPLQLADGAAHAFRDAADAASGTPNGALRALLELRAALEDFAAGVSARLPSGLVSVSHRLLEASWEVPVGGMGAFGAYAPRRLNVLGSCLVAGASANVAAHVAGAGAGAGPDAALLAELEARVDALVASLRDEASGARAVGEGECPRTEDLLSRLSDHDAQGGEPVLPRAIARSSARLARPSFPRLAARR